MASQGRVTIKCLSHRQIDHFGGPHVIYERVAKKLALLVLVRLWNDSRGTVDGITIWSNKTRTTRVPQGACGMPFPVSGLLMR